MTTRVSPFVYLVPDVWESDRLQSGTIARRLLGSLKTL